MSNSGDENEAAFQPGSLDTLSPAERSERMSRIAGKDTKPEMRVRRLVHGLGYRYRLHAPELPGKPDLVFRPRKKAIHEQERDAEQRSR